MASPTSSIGYEGTVTEAGWSKLADLVGQPYAVGGPNDWAVSAVTGVDRTVRIAAGWGYGHGVLDTLDASVTVQHPLIASGVRWDTIVVRRDWTTPAGSGTTTINYLVGGASSTIAGTVRIGPGVVDDQVLALVQLTAGVQVPTAVIDLRALPLPLLVATSSTRPGTYGRPAPKQGQTIFETDTSRLVTWNGATWKTAADPPSSLVTVAGPSIGNWFAGGRFARWKRNGVVTIDVELTRYGIDLTASGNYVLHTLPLTDWTPPAGVAMAFHIKHPTHFVGLDPKWWEYDVAGYIDPTNGQVTFENIDTLYAGGRLTGHATFVNLD